MRKKVPGFIDKRAAEKMWKEEGEPTGSCRVLFDAWVRWRNKGVFTGLLDIDEFTEGLPDKCCCCIGERMLAGEARRDGCASRKQF
jgi:hypothetical protein